jgi:hypothetical protein
METILFSYFSFFPFDEINIALVLLTILFGVLVLKNKNQLSRKNKILSIFGITSASIYYVTLLINYFFIDILYF